MTISYTALLGLAQPVTGTETGQWGTVVNDEITALLEDAVANAASISVTAGNVTLSTTNGSSNQARMSTLIITGTPGTTRNVVAPSQAKIYVVINQSDGAVVIKGAATSGVTIGAGQTAQVAWNGSDFVEIGNYVHGNFVVNGNLSVNGDSTLGNAGADTTTINGQVIAANSNISKTTTLSASAPALAWIKGATYTDTGTAGGTTQALAPFTVFSTPTLSTSNIVTYTDAATVYIAGAPAAAGSATITNPYSLYVAAGNAYFGASVSATTLDLTNLEVTNIKAKDGTASMTLADSTGVVTVVKDQLVNGVTVGRGAGAVATNTAVGASALAANTTGYNNTAISQNSGAKITTGYDNISIGISSNGFNSATGATTGNNNVAVGDFALTYLQSGSSNTAVGSAALNANTTASNNTAVGYQAGYTNQTGSNNVANGYQALFTNTSDNNVAVGYQAGHGITTGANNTTIGHLAGKTITTGSFNVAVGRLSMDNSAGVTGTENTAVGNGTLRALTSGINNTVIGTASGSLITTGSKNTILGAYTGNQGGIDIRTSSNNIVLSDGDGNPRQVYNNTGGTSLSAVPLNAASIRGYELGTGGAAYHGNGARSYITANGYWNDVQWTRPLALPACQIVLDHNSGNIVMQSAVTGSAGSAIAFTQVFGVNIGQTVALQGATPQNGTGITFPATQNASSDANTLDDYEEGEYDVTMSTSASGSITLVAGENRFSYTKIGRQVTVTGAIQIDSVSSPVGFFNISLPFAIADLTEAAGRGSASVVVVNVVSANVADFLPISIEGESNLRVYLGDGTNIQDDSAQQLQATSGIYVTFTYFA